MKIILFSREDSRHLPDELARVMNAIDVHGFDFVVNREFAPILEQASGRQIDASQIYDEGAIFEQQEAIMVCCGGDGTLLEGARRLHGKRIPVVGINSGRLGFLTAVAGDGIEQLFCDIAEQKLRIEERSMLTVEGSIPQSEAQLPALNEVALQRHGAGMISVEASVDGQVVATYHGDGVIISTPTGSTAYSLSAGGPIVAPACACLILSPLAPHNLTMRPVVIPDNSIIRFKLYTRESEALLTLDNRTFTLSDCSEITIRKADNKIYLATPHNISFYHTLRNKLMWGVDIRS